MLVQIQLPAGTRHGTGKGWIHLVGSNPTTPTITKEVAMMYGLMFAGGALITALWIYTYSAAYCKGFEAAESIWKPEDN